MVPGSRIAAGGGTYCSNVCRLAAKTVSPRKCEHCGQPYTPRPKTGSRFCSRQCSGASTNLKITRSCDRCGTNYQANLKHLSEGRGQHCSRACAVPGSVTREWERCGKSFTAVPSELARGWGRFCSNKCRRVRVERVCRTCGATFEVRKSKGESEGTGYYCSVPCRGLANRNRVTRECVVCSKIFERPASVAARAATIYCSRACNSTARSTNPAEVERVRTMQRNHLASRGPTRPERILYALLDELVNTEEWRSQYFVFDKWTVDACIPALRLVIQADGTYWHGYDPATRMHPMIVRNIRNDRSQAAYLAKAGWHLLRLWEH